MTGPYAPTDLTGPTPTPIGDPGVPAKWSAPDGLAEQAAEQAVKAPEATTTDMIQADATPPEYPAGAPELRPYMRLRFLERAEYMEKLDPLWAKVQALPKQGDEAGPKEAATMYRTLAEIDDLMRGVAVDLDAYDAWVAIASDAQFMQLFSAYIAGSQPGEAAGSSS